VALLGGILPTGKGRASEAASSAAAVSLTSGGGVSATGEGLGFIVLDPEVGVGEMDPELSVRVIGPGG
jgi:hypothetical protein